MATALLEALSDARFYGPEVDRVDVIETHVSWVFLAGDRAYKVKKPIRLPFLDYRPLETRRRFCHEEVRLNRRLAPDLYLGVRSIVATSAGYELVDGDRDDAVEYAVEMRRIPAGHTLAERIAGDDLVGTELEQVARTIAHFHATAPRASEPVPFIDQLRGCMDSLVAARPSTSTRLLRTALNRIAVEHACELERRAQQRLVRDGHGDLRCEHIVVGRRIEVFDCIEFDRDLREVDVGVDLAFLAMDLEHLDRAQEAKHLVEVYRRAGGRPGSPELFALFCAYRACVRALVSSLRARQLDGPRRARAWEECEAYLRLAWTYVWRRHRPIVLAMCGPAAAGKTRLAVELAELTGLPRLSSDRIRKRLGGLEPEQRGDRSLYAQTMSDSVYRRLGLDAAEFPEGAIVDATFRRRADRTTFARALEPFEPIFINCVLSRALTARRARTREREPDHESDAGVSEALAQWDAFEPLTEIPPNGRIDVSTAPRVELVAMQLESKLAQTLNARSLEDDCDFSPAPIRGNYRRPARDLAGSSMS